jgi:hypothetical protein
MNYYTPYRVKYSLPLRAFSRPAASKKLERRQPSCVSSPCGTQKLPQIQQAFNPISSIAGLKLNNFSPKTPVSYFGDKAFINRDMYEKLPTSYSMTTYNKASLSTR